MAERAVKVSTIIITGEDTGSADIRGITRQQVISFHIETDFDIRKEIEEVTMQEQKGEVRTGVGFSVAVGGQLFSVAEKTFKKTTPNKTTVKKGISSRSRIVNALRELLTEKDFNSITTDEIAKKSGKNVSLIYRYFGDKRGLLHKILADYLREAERGISLYSRKKLNSIELLKQIVFDCLDHYNRNYVYARILFVETRTFPGFFNSETYELVRKFSRRLLDIITIGIANGEIRNDVPAEKIRDVILGSIEHLSLPKALFGKNIDPEKDAEYLSKIIMDGIRAK